MNPAEIIASLDRIDQEAAALAAAIKAMIPEKPDRDDPTWESHTCAGACGANAKRCAAALRRAVRETMGGQDDV